MQLLVNGSKLEISANTLDALLLELGYSERVATAVNEVFVPKSKRTATHLSAGDRIEILAPMQGG